MFKKLTKSVVNNIDSSKEWVPVDSRADSEHFRPLCLLKKSKPETIFHSAPYYKRTGFTLRSVLLPGKDGKSIECHPAVFDPFTVARKSTDEAEADASISIEPANSGAQGGASSSTEFSIMVQKKSISQDSLEALSKERQINMDHSFIRQVQKTDIKLYVVTEILEASEETICKESKKSDWGFKAKVYAAISIKATKKGTKSKQESIPEGCTLAFRALELDIRDGAWEPQYLKPAVRLMSSGISGPSKGKLEEVEKEVKNRCQIFSKLSPDLMLIILNTIKAVMRDRNLLQELSNKMEEIAEQNDGYELKTESPDLKDLYSTLQHSPRGRILQLAQGITYILDALHELMDDQLLLLLEALERKIVSQQLNLVASLLEHDLGNGKEPFHVDAGLLSFPHKEEQALTIALLELSGVQLQEDGSALPRAKSFEDVAALFVALYTFNLLTGSRRRYQAQRRKTCCKVL